MSQETLRRLADLAADDPDLLASLRTDFESALISYGFDDLTDAELQKLRDFNEGSGNLDDAAYRKGLTELAAA